jgi:Lrp/AsnC family leucine-responsive transcriptional regulator
MLEQSDLDLLAELQHNCRRPITQIAESLGRPTATVRDRVKRLEEMGVIRGYSANIDPASLGYSLQALIQITVEEKIINPEQFFAALGEIPEVENVKLVTGDYEALVTVRVESIDHLRRILYEDIVKVPWVTKTNTSVVLLEYNWPIARGRLRSATGPPAGQP